MFYHAPSFEGKAIVDGEEKYMQQAVYLHEKTYYAVVEKFGYQYFLLIAIAQICDLL